MIKRLKPYLASPNGPCGMEKLQDISEQDHSKYWPEFSPANMSTFCGKINHPIPEYTTPTQPKTPLVNTIVSKERCVLKIHYKLKQVSTVHK